MGNLERTLSKKLDRASACSQTQILERIAELIRRGVAEQIEVHPMRSWVQVNEYPGLPDGDTRFFLVFYMQSYPNFLRSRKIAVNRGAVFVLNDEVPCEMGQKGPHWKWAGGFRTENILLESSELAAYLERHGCS